MSNKVQSNNRSETSENFVTISVCCSMISLGIAISYLVARYPLEMPFDVLFKSLGLSFLFLCIPVTTQEFFTKPQSRLYQASWLFLLLIACILGWFFSLNLASYIIACLGYVVFLMTTRNWFKAAINFQSTFLLIACLIFGCWLAASVWSKGSLTPFLWEKASALTAHPDTLFHISISNMLRYYHVASTGLDGLVPLQYHYGSHLIFATLSNFMNVSTFHFFEVGYPLLFFPALISSILSTSLYIAQLLSRSNAVSLRINWWVWSGLLLLFIGIIPTGMLYKVAMPPLLFFSESYVVSLTILLFTLPLLFDFATSVEKNPYFKTLKFALLLFLTLFIGFTKISELYLLLILGWGTVLYGRLTKIPAITTKAFGLFVITLSIASFILFRQVKLADHQTSWQLGHYLTDVVAVRLIPAWLILGLGHVWLYLIFYFLQAKKTTLILTLLFALTLGGLLPGLVFNLGPNGNYFVDGARWMVVLLLLGQTNSLQELANKLFNLTSNKAKITAVVLGAFFLAMFIQNFLQPFEVIFTEKKALAITSPPQNFETLKRLGSEKHQARMALYFEQDSELSARELGCTDLGFIPTSISGYAILAGTPPESCNYNRYGYAVYKNSRAEVLENDVEICEYALSKNFSKVTIFSDSTNSTIECPK